MTDTPPSTAQKLTRREHQVLAHLHRKRSTADIACALDIAPDTVKTYLRRLYRKLDVHSRKQAVERTKLGRQS